MAILGTATVSVIAQGQRNDTNSSSSGYVQTSKIIGTNVKTAQGEQIGAVKDVVLDRNTGCIAYTVLSGDGTAGTAKIVAVPWAMYSSNESGGLIVSVDRDRIYSGPAFDYSRIDEYSTAEYIDNLNSYFGVSAGVVSSAATTEATTTSTGRGKAETSASPTQNASPKVGTSPRTTRNPTTKRGSPQPLQCHRGVEPEPAGEGQENHRQRALKDLPPRANRALANALRERQPNQVLPRLSKDRYANDPIYNSHRLTDRGAAGMAVQLRVGLLSNGRPGINSLDFDNSSRAWGNLNVCLARAPSL